MTATPDSRDKLDGLDAEKADWSAKTVDVPTMTGPDGKKLDLGAEFMVPANELNATPEERKAVFRKIDKRLLIMIVWVYLVQFSDK